MSVDYWKILRDEAEAMGVRFERPEGAYLATDARILAHAIEREEEKYADLVAVCDTPKAHRLYYLRVMAWALDQFQKIEVYPDTDQFYKDGKANKLYWVKMHLREYREVAG